MSINAGKLPWEGRGKCDIKFSSPLRVSRSVSFRWLSILPEPTRLLTHVECVTANNGIEKRGSAYDFYFYHLFFPRKDILAVHWKFIYQDLCFDIIKMKKIRGKINNYYVNNVVFLIFFTHMLFCTNTLFNYIFSLNSLRITQFWAQEKIDFI